MSIRSGARERNSVHAAIHEVLAHGVVGGDRRRHRRVCADPALCAAGERAGLRGHAPDDRGGVPIHDHAGAGISLVTGLLAMAVHRPFQELRWVWVKALLGISMFEATLAIIQAKGADAARISAKIAAGEPLQGDLRRPYRASGRRCSQSLPFRLPIMCWVCGGRRWRCAGRGMFEGDQLRAKNSPREKRSNARFQSVQTE